MAKYRIRFAGTVTTTVEVEAETREDAIEAAFEDLPGSLCQECAGHYDLDQGSLDVAIDSETGEQEIELIEA
ncbi:hypothetical protein N5079_25170 [Planotetraspora sp. A-T 1434]|uniref:hypothetical protein n=1 Tax=Planotetraspora sp. A-T 1434 TaxID=2979219 RepID=UPI0021C0F15B|nr:hypothetical protein [Planotetraspora sp. A-T 1434]MCT9933509.1 hypothetical protein [Planotetraspora sp. A-T 1434]